MLMLITDRSKYFRVKRGQNAGEIENTLNSPVNGRAFAGAIVEIRQENLTRYCAQVGDTYKTVASKFNADEQLLKSINGFKPVYPTCKLFVPCK